MTKNHPKISVVMIVKNEESCLNKCLQSVKGLGEIVICDTGSEDSTVEIAKKYTDKVFTDYKWNDSMCEARNHALGKATGDWVLSIDADEVLDSQDKVIEAIEKFTDAKVINCILQANGKGETFLFPRLFKRCEEVYWGGAIHNYLSINQDNNSEVKILYSYSDAHQKDPDRTLRILGKEVALKPDCIREKFYLAREYFYRQNWERAIFWYEDYMKTAWWNKEMAEAELQLCKCYLKLKDYNKAKEHCLKAILINADFKEALIVMSELTGLKNKVKWLAFAELAKNDDVLFIRKI